MKNGFTIVMVAAVALVGFGCGDDDGDEGASVATVSVERYCKLTRELDRAGGRSSRISRRTRTPLPRTSKPPSARWSRKTRGP